MTEEEFRKQDRTMPANGLSTADMQALNTFIARYPTWWWKLGWCNVSRDFDAATQAHSPEMRFSKRSGDIWDRGFSCDHSGTFADAIYDVMAQIEEAKSNV